MSCHFKLKSVVIFFKFLVNLLFFFAVYSEDRLTIATRQSFWLIFDNFVMALVSTGQSKCKNYERRSCQAPRSSHGVLTIDISASHMQFLHFDLLV